MNKIKYFIFILIMVVIGGAIIIPRLNKDIRNVEDNTAEGITLEEGSYREGVDIQAGIYDIICISEKGEYRMSKFDKGERIVGEEMLKNNQIDIIKGTFKFVPSSFEPIQTNSEGNYELIHTGTYTFGKEIPAGTYRIFVEGSNPLHPVKAIVTADLNDSKANIVALNEDREDYKEVSATVKNGDVIWIQFKLNLLGEEDTGIKVILEPQ